MARTVTQHLQLRRGADGYYRTTWYDDSGRRHQRSFGRKRNAAYRRFNEFQAEWRRDWHVRNPSDEGPITVRRAWEKYDEQARTYYRRADGTPTGEATNIAHAMTPVLELYGEMPARDFSVRDLRAVRDRMVEEDLSLDVINARVRRIRHVWKWFAREELVPTETWSGLQVLDALKPGRTEARSNDPVGPVPDAHVEAVLEVVPPTLGAMIRLQWLTGMRPQEVCGMRAIDLEVQGSVWIYRPQQHKTAHRRKERWIPLGPRAQEVVQPFLGHTPYAPLFSPRQAQRERFASRETHRHQPTRAPATGRRVRTSYDTQAYGKAVRRACDDAGVPWWSPNQLRHNAATRLRQEFGLDVAQVVLGHAKADVTQIYAELDMQKAVDVMERVG